MTDNRTTELLRKLLDERGVKYEAHDHMGACETSWNGFTATQLSPNANLIMAVTPEQAIAATLCARAERTCECIAEHAESPIDGKTIVLHRCSACHELMRPYMRFCPNCGAKVAGE